MHENERMKKLYKLVETASKDGRSDVLKVLFGTLSQEQSLHTLMSSVNKTLNDSEMPNASNSARKFSESFNKVSEQLEAELTPKSSIITK